MHIYFIFLHNKMVIPYSYLIYLVFFLCFSHRFIVTCYFVLAFFDLLRHVLMFLVIQITKHILLYKNINSNQDRQCTTKL